MKKEVGLSPRGKRSLIIAVIVIVAIFLILLVFQFYLYFNFLLGNDIAVRVNLDKEFLDLKHGEKGDIEVTAKVFTNPFCEAECNYSFSDLDNNKEIETGNFALKNSEPFSGKYSVTSPEKGVGDRIYRFEISCLSSRALLCYTGSEPFYQDSLVVVHYDLSDSEGKIKEDTRLALLGLAENFSFMDKYFFELKSKIGKSPLKIEGVDEKALEISYANEKIDSIRAQWEDQNYSQSEDSLKKINLGDTLESLRNFSNAAKEQINRYNNLSVDFAAVQVEFAKDSLSNYSDSTLQEAVLLSERFIEARNRFLEKSYLLTKGLDIYEMTDCLSDLNNLSQEDLANNRERNNSLALSFNLTLANRIELDENFSVGVELTEPGENCCLFDSCVNCCDNCNSNASLYPVIFLHGHDFSSKVSAEYNLNIFEEMQREIENDGFLNAGTMMVNVPEDVPEKIWARIQWPISVKMSYYFDSVKEEGKLNILQTKKDNIDTYSIRLKNIVDSIKKKTGKDKVILVTHSMGGLVARRYIQVFGEDSVYKLVMIGSPNQGISDGTYRYCTTFGESKECEDMQKGSLFLAKLRGQKFEKVNVTNIIGVGCDTSGSDGDGVVEKDSATLQGVQNFYVSGECSGFDYLHSDLVDPKKYPETYEILKRALKN